MERVCQRPLDPDSHFLLLHMHVLSSAYSVELRSRSYYVDKIFACNRIWVGDPAADGHLFSPYLAIPTLFSDLPRLVL